MKFSEFELKTLLEDTDYFVGYKRNGKNFRITKSNLKAALGVASVQAQSVSVQYSENGTTFHDVYAIGDIYMRIKSGSGAWSGNIRIAVNAYDIWLSQGNTGTMADFLEAIKGDSGEPFDVSSLQLENMGGYNNFLQSITTALDNKKSAIVSEVTESIKNVVKEQYKEVNLSDINEVKTLTGGDYVTIATADGLRKIKVENLIANVSVQTASKTSLESVTKEQRRIIPLTGDQNDSNVDFTTQQGFVLGTSDLYLNGQRLVAGIDYVEKSSFSIAFLTQIPKPTDKIVFLAVLQ